MDDGLQEIQVHTMTIRVAVIGAGGRGRMFRLAHKPHEGVALAAVCDVSQAVRDDYAANYPGVAVYDDYQRMLDDGPYDAVAVMSPDFLHEDHGLAALRTGAAIYLEKPIAITPQGCERLLATAAEHGSRLYVGHNMRFFPVIRKMKEIIDSGRIGKVQAVWCRHFIDYGSRWRWP